CDARRCGPTGGAQGLHDRGARRTPSKGAAMPVSQRVVQVCLYLVAAIALTGGTLQFVLGQPDTSPRLDNVHRFMAGVYFSTALIAAWAARSLRGQGPLVY